jgi:hypothetical protein
MSNADQPDNRQTIDPSAIPTAQEHSTSDATEPKMDAKDEVPKRRFEDLPPAAQRALKEAEERRKERDALKESKKMPREIGGRGGLDPARYDDYEIGGRAIDF